VNSSKTTLKHYYEYKVERTNVASSNPRDYDGKKYNFLDETA